MATLPAMATDQVIVLPRRVPVFSFGDRVRKARRDAHYSQEQFAALLGVGKQALGQWEAGRSRPADVLATAHRVEHLTGVPVEWLLGLWDGGRPGSSAGTSSDCRTRALSVALALPIAA